MYLLNPHHIPKINENGTEVIYAWVLCSFSFLIHLMTCLGDLSLPRLFQDLTKTTWKDEVRVTT